MAFLFGGRNRQRSNSDLCRSTKDLLLKLESNTDDRLTPRFEEDLARNLGQMKLTLQGTSGMLVHSHCCRPHANNQVEIETSPQQVYQLVHLLMSEDVLLPLASNIHRLPFETRKDAQVIFSSLFRYKPNVPNAGPDPPVLSYVVHDRPEIVSALCYGYNHRESAMPCGGILREALKYDSICARILYDEPGRTTPLQQLNANIKASGQGIFWKFFEWIDKGAFEVCADAFATFRVCIKTERTSTLQLIIRPASRRFSSNTNSSSPTSCSPISTTSSLFTTTHSSIPPPTSQSANPSTSSRLSFSSDATTPS